MTVVIVMAIALLGIWFFLFCPSLRRRKMKSFCSGVIAHRGVHDDPMVDENSLSAFRLAVERGLGIELDVRLTSDEIPVIMHDTTLQRMCGTNRLVSSLKLDELRKYHLAVSGESIPTLEEALGLIDGKVPLIIELKSDDGSHIAERTADVMRQYKGEYAVECFDPRCMYRYRKISPETTRGLLAQRKRGSSLAEKLVFSMAGALLFNFLARPDFIAYRHSDSIGINMKLCCVLGARTIAWTVRTPEEYKKALASYDIVIGENIPTDVADAFD